MKQNLTITGLGAPTFTDSVKVGHEIFLLFQQQFAANELEPWRTSTYSGSHSLELSNRYFTSRRDAADGTHIPFTEIVDPRGILEEMAKANYIHMEENEVRYYRSQTDEEGVVK